MSPAASASATGGAGTPADASAGRLRRRLAPPAGLALLMAGGALAVRVAVMTAAGDDRQTEWLFTAAALVLAGVALVLVALPKLVPGKDEDTEPPPGPTSGQRG